MNKRQYNVLKDLATSLRIVSMECLNDDNFNDMIAGLNIFTKSIDELANDIENKLEEVD